MEIEKFKNFNKRYSDYKKIKETAVKKPDEYSEMTEYVKKFDMVPYLPHVGSPQGIYTLNNNVAPVDLRKCELNDISILKQALSELSDRCTTWYYENSERRDMY